MYSTLKNLNKKDKEQTIQGEAHVNNAMIDIYIIQFIKSVAPFSGKISSLLRVRERKTEKLYIMHIVLL